MKMLLLEDPSRRIPIDRIEEAFGGCMQEEGELAMGMN
jgi:hypothetical protein